MKVFISQPMKDKSDEEILETCKRIMDIIINELDSKETQLLPSFIKLSERDTTMSKNLPVLYLSKSIELLSHADISVFAEGFDKFRGCLIEYKISKEYGIPSYKVVGNKLMKVED